MQTTSTIQLNQWQMLQTATRDPAAVLAAMHWQPVRLPFILPMPDAAEHVWLRTDFEMLPNEACSRWWLELDVQQGFAAQLWVNQQPVDLPASAAVDITGTVAMGNNVLLFKIVTLPTDDMLWRAAACVSYPCG